jgi:hypothetical protein
MSAKVCFQLNPRVQAMDFNPAWRLTTSIPSNFDLNSGTRYDQALLVAFEVLLFPEDDANVRGSLQPSYRQRE